MPDKRISEFPIGELTPFSQIPIVSNGETSQILFLHLLAQTSSRNIRLTGGTYNAVDGIATFYLNSGDSFDVTGYFTTPTAEDINNKQNSMDYDGTAIMYPTVDAVNGLLNSVALAILNTGFIDSTDSFVMSMVDNFTLSLSASSKGVIFKSILETPPYVTSTAILNIPSTVIPLSNIGLTNDGVYVRFIGYNDSGQIVYSNTTFKGLNNIAQLGVLILKVSSGVTSFLDSTRNVINIPSICGYSNLELTMLGLQSNVTIKPNNGTVSVNNSNGNIRGMSVNWHGANNDNRPIASSNLTQFTHLSQANALAPIAPPLTNTVTTNQYWNGASLVNLSASGSASIQRWIVTVNGGIALQYGEQEYVDLNTAIKNLSIAKFLHVIPSDTYVEIGRMAAVSGATNLGDNNQAEFIITGSKGNGSASNTTFWGEIDGIISNQTDLYHTLQPIVDNSFVNLGTATTATTIVDLSAHKNYRVIITGGTTFNFIPSYDGTENNLVINMPLPTNSTVTLPSNVKWHNNVVIPIANQDSIVNSTFTTGSGFGSLVNTLTLQSDGKIIVGGNFTTYNGSAQNYITRLNSNGTLDYTFNIGSGCSTYVYCTIQQPSDNKIVVGGAFSSYYGVSQNYITRINLDGTLDTTFNIGSGFNSYVYTIKQQSDNKILVGGNFTTYNGVTQNYITRLNLDGSIDNTFNTGSGFNGSLNGISPQPDGKIFVGGQFTTYNGNLFNNIIKLNIDGTPDLSFNARFNNYVSIIARQSDNKLLLSGGFTAYNPIVANSIIKINYDGSQDTSFNMGTGFNSVAWIARQQNDKKLIVVGGFTQYSGQPITHAARLNTDGTLDTSFNIGGTGFNVTTSSVLTIQSADSKVLIGGQFTQYNGLTQNRLIRLNPDGSVDNSFNIGTGFNNSVQSIEVQSDNKILVGGQFNTYNGASYVSMIRLNPDGSIDNTFNAGTGFNGTNFYNLTLQPDGKVLVGGGFTPFSAASQNYITRLNSDGTKDVTFSGNSGLGGNGRVNTMCLQPDGKIIVGGLYTNSGQTAGYGGITRLNTDGSLDASFAIGSGLFGLVYNYGITLQSDGKVVVGTSSTVYNGATIKNLIRLNTNGSLDTTFNSGNTGFINGSTITYQPLQSSGETKLFITGGFTQYNGTPQNYLIRLNPDGSYDNTFNIGAGFNSTVTNLIIQPDNKIIVSGQFSQYNGLPTSPIIRLFPDGRYDSSFTNGTSFNGKTGNFGMLLTPDNSIIFGGYFSIYNGVTVNYIVKLSSCTENNLFLKLKQEGTNMIIK